MARARVMGMGRHDCVVRKGPASGSRGRPHVHGLFAPEVSVAAVAAVAVAVYRASETPVHVSSRLVRPLLARRPRFRWGRSHAQTTSSGHARPRAWPYCKSSSPPSPLPWLAGGPRRRQEGKGEWIHIKRNGPLPSFSQRHVRVRVVFARRLRDPQPN